MKTSRIFRIFMMALDTFVLAFLRLFRKFTHLFAYEPSEETLGWDLPHATELTKPERLGIRAELEVNGERVERYSRSEPIYFDPEQPYTDMEGIVTFRGDNFRSGGAYGTATLRARKFGRSWDFDTGRLEKGYGHGFWTGSGWTGQPLIVRWSDEMKRAMNLAPAKKGKKGLVEAVYSTMDGNVYFLDIEDGSLTRAPISVGLPFKGAGALHPSLPLLHLGPGDSGPSEDLYARAYLYSLTDGEKLLEYGGRDPFALRKFHGFDSSPLFHEATDTLIEPGENGILYTMKLNTAFDPVLGKLTIQPSERVKLRYSTSRSSEESYWLGMEDSAVAWKNYLYIADNGGNLLCININTMEVVWAQDVADDTNGSPVLSIEGGVPYLYIATSLHWTASPRLRLADVPIFKINAVTGEYVWRRTYFCNTIAGISGGIQATCAVGRPGSNIEDLVIFPVARTPQVRAGILVALDKQTGREVWRTKLKRYAWSSPVAVYDENGNAVIVQGDSVGNLYLIDGATGEILDRMALGSNIEATPAVFENTIVVGTRGQKIFGIRLR